MNLKKEIQSSKRFEYDFNVLKKDTKIYDV
jgi:hypothetical protein